MNAPYELSAVEIAAGIHSRTLRPAEVLSSHVQRIAQREPSLSAFSFFDRDMVERQLATLPRGRLYGVPVAVKDVIDVGGMPAAYGSSIWHGHVPRADSAAVSALRREGALIIGKTVTAEFAVRQPGATVNPHNPGHTPGGSSSGSAAGVAAHLFPLALGTQTAGSIIRPSAYCGVVGYKPTFGWVQRAGTKMTADSLDTIGPMGRTVADVALIASVLSGRDFGSVDEAPERKLRVGICRTIHWDSADSYMKRHFDHVVSRLEQTTAVVDCELPQNFSDINALHASVQYWETAQCLAWELDIHGEDMSPGLRQLLSNARNEPVQVYEEALARIEMLRRQFDVLLRERDVDVLLTLSAAGEAPVGLHSTGEAIFNRAWTALHVPCINLPAGIGPNGLPLGVQLVARRNGDVALLRAAAWVHERLQQSV